MENDNKDVDCPENIVGENMNCSMSVFNLAMGKEICTSGQCDVFNKYQELEQKLPQE